MEKSQIPHRGQPLSLVHLFVLLMFLGTLMGIAIPGSTARGETFEMYGMTVDTNATAVTLGKVAVNDFDQFHDYLRRLPHLQTFDMYDTFLPRSEMAVLTELFPHVRFGWTIRFRGYRIRTDATAFSTLKDGSPPYFNGDSLNWLAYCKDLLALDLGHNIITDLSFLYGLPKLRILILACNRITDLTPLASLPDLEYLELFQNDISDVTPLGGLQKLIDLNLCVNEISDPTPLYGLKGLERLWISRNSLTQEQQQALRDALPQTEMNFDVQFSTQGGWRTHDRYQVIRRVFRRGIYQPWNEGSEVQ